MNNPCFKAAHTPLANSSRPFLDPHHLPFRLLPLPLDKDKDKEVLLHPFRLSNNYIHPLPLQDPFQEEKCRLRTNLSTENKKIKKTVLFMPVIFHKPTICFPFKANT